MVLRDDPPDDHTVIPPSPSSSRRVLGILDVFAGVILFAGILGFSWLALTVPPIQRIPAPEHALALTVSRTLDLEYAIVQQPRWEQWVFAVLSGGGGSPLPLAIAWYEEITQFTDDPRVSLYLTILQAEAGRMDDVHSRVVSWRTRRQPFPLYARLVESAYGLAPVDAVMGQVLLAQLAEELPGGWFYERLALKLSHRVDNDVFYTATASDAVQRGSALFNRARVLVGVEGGILVVGVGGILFLYWVRRTHRAFPFLVGPASFPPPWEGRVGVKVLLRGGAVGILLVVVIVDLVAWSSLVRAIALPLLYLPFLWLTSHSLLRPNGRGLISGFGLRPFAGHGGRIVFIVTLMAAVSLGVDVGVGFLANAWGYHLHWTEWFIPELVWGDAFDRTIGLVDIIVFAPFFEELVFRGVLFGTFRTTFTFLPSALLSASVFSLAHGYGPVGLLSVWWSGMIWAWGYEKTGSLLPGMLAHCVNNALVCMAVMVLYR